MIEENTRPLSARPEPSLKDVSGDDITDDEPRRLEWAGIRSVAQLREVQRSAGSEVIGRMSTLPVDRLRAALENAARPRVSDIAMPGALGSRPRPPALRIQGENLYDGDQPESGSAGASPSSAGQSSRTRRSAGRWCTAGMIEIRTAPGLPPRPRST